MNESLCAVGDSGKNSQVGHLWRPAAPSRWKPPAPSRRSLDADIDGAALRLAVRRKLASVPAVGPTITRTLIAALPEPGKLSRKEIAARRPSSASPPSGGAAA
jgi:hypothetical protein